MDILLFLQSLNSRKKGQIIGFLLMGPSRQNASILNTVQNLESLNFRILVYWKTSKYRENTIS